MNNKEQKALCDDWEKEFDEWAKSFEVTMKSYDKNANKHVCALCGINKEELRKQIKTLLQKQRAEILKELRDECVGEERQLDELSGYPDNCIVGMNIKRRELIEIFNNKLK